MRKRVTADDFSRWERERQEFYGRFLANWRRAYEADQRRLRRLRRLTLGVFGRHESIPPPPSL